MKNDKPHAVLAMGSYASAGPIGAAILLGIPTVLHEANVIPGRAVALFSRWTTAIAGSFEETRYYLRRKEIVLTGMPLRKTLLAEPPAPFLPPGFTRGSFTILVIGGSGGAKKLNQIIPASITSLTNAGNKIQVIHLSGDEDEKAVRQQYAAAGIPHFVHAFYNDMGNLYRLADLAICRSGAATCAELCAFSLPALLIPYPYATHNHQLMNARALEKKGVADVILEKGLAVDWLVEYIRDCQKNPARLARMKSAAKKIVLGNAAANLADLVINVAARHYEQ